MKTILVTGGAGFIGSFVVERLLKDGHRVVCIDNFNDFYDPAIKKNNIASALKNDHFHLYEDDIRNTDVLEKIFSQHQFDVVVHLAARAGVRPSLKEPYLYNDVNTIGTLNLLECCRNHAVPHFVFGSTSSIYGINNKIPFTESDPVPFPISPYAASKLGAEALCHTYHHIYGTKIVILRFFTVYGPRQRPEMAIHKFTRDIVNNEPVVLFGNGYSKRDYTYVDDIVEGVVQAAYSDLSFEIINLGDSKTIELYALVDAIQSALGKKATIQFINDQPGDVPMTYANIDKARTLLGYQPTVLIEEGVKRFCSWYLENMT